MLNVGAILFGLAMRLLALGGGNAAAEPNAPPPRAVTFAGDVQPILRQRCTPCHFPGGSMHAKLPFDRPETIARLDTRLFTRIKKENEQAIIRAYLASIR